MNKHDREPVPLGELVARPSTIREAIKALQRSQPVDALCGQSERTRLSVLHVVLMTGEPFGQFDNT